MSSLSAYAFRAARRDGVTEIGVVEAETRRAAAALLTRRGLFPIDLSLRDDRELRTRLTASELALGLRILAELLGTGLSLGRTLTAFEELAPPGWRPGLPALREAVRQGQGLSSALNSMPLRVPHVVIHVVAAGEAAGQLAPGVLRAAEMVEFTARTITAIRSALAYPLVLLTAGTLSFSVLVSSVMPRFATMIADTGGAPPASTRLVLGAGAFLRTNALLGALGLLGGIVAWKMWTSSQAGRIRWHELLLRLPLVGPIRRALVSARVAATLAALLRSGMTIASALRHAAAASGDAAVGARLIRAREHVLNGRSIGGSLAAELAVSPTLIRLIRAGEVTGRLTDMMEHGARLESEYAARAVRTAVGVVEPALVVGFGVLVAVVATALLQAVYGLQVR